MKKNNNKVWIAVIAVLVVVIAVLIAALVRRKPKDDVEKVTSEEAVQTETEAVPETSSDATAAATTEAQTVQDCFVKVTNSNSWESANGYSGQLDSTITNKTSGALKNWEIRMTVPDKTTVDSSWNGTFKLEGTTLSVISVDYNTEVPAKGNLKDIGVIVTVPSQADLKAICDSAVLYVDGKEYKGSSASAATETTEAEEKKEETKPKKKVEAESGTPLDNHGKLTLKGTDIVDKNGDKYQLKGVSTHGIAWFPEYVNQDAFESLRDDMGANLIRIAMYSGENNGYCTGGDQQKLKDLVKTGVDAATNLGMYVIIDWHVLGDLNPQTYKEEAKAFFEEMSALYKDYDNVIYEICNEPNGGTTWADVKSYAEEVIPIIRKNAKDALIIVGTPNWSQDVDIAAEDPVTGYDNIMYAIHFYAATHTDNIRNKVTTALSKGLPIFVSEFSICDASGNGAIDYDQAAKWFDLIDENNLSYAAWNLSNKDETSSLISSSCTKTSGWTDADYSETGKWLKKQMHGEN